MQRAAQRAELLRELCVRRHELAHQPLVRQAKRLFHMIPLAPLCLEPRLEIAHEVNECGVVELIGSCVWVPRWMWRGRGH